MSNCEGRGDCIQQCWCICYEGDVCTCSHRNHTHLIGGTTDCDVYCQKECPHNCQLVECHNFRMCEQKRPQNILDCHNGMCSDCAIMIGKIKFVDEKDDCPICLVNKYMIEISCGKHKFCLDCWKNWSETSTQSPLSCPLCRNPIWK